MDTLAIEQMRTDVTKNTTTINLGKWAVGIVLTIVALATPLLWSKLDKIHEGVHGVNVEVRALNVKQEAATQRLDDHIIQSRKDGR